MKGLPALFRKIARQHILVIGDVMLDQFIWGHVGRISPEAPVPVVDFDRESFMPGGAANVARNLTALGCSTHLLGVVGKDSAAEQVRTLLRADRVDCAGLVPVAGRHTSIKTRIIAHQQQIARVDRESRNDLARPVTDRLLAVVDRLLPRTDAVIVGDYAKGVVTQELLDGLKVRCRKRGVWLSVDPKPSHRLGLEGLSLVTPNRKEAFELASQVDGTRSADPLQDEALMRVAAQLLRELQPALLLVTLGDQGMLLCQKGKKPFHIRTMAQEVFDVSGAGDTVIASFTLAIAAGASPVEADIFSNHAAGVVVGKVGTATVTGTELLHSFHHEP